jgi:phytoene dehydrogenase-like protein
MPDYDGIILGTGHNALVLQAYLSRCGLKTISIDRATVPGGGLTTVENPNLPGFQHNTHSFFHRAITDMPWFNDLELARHGVNYIEPELNVALLSSDGRSLEWWTNFEKTYQSFALFSESDAATLRHWHDEFAAIVQNIVVPEAQCPPLPTDNRQALLQKSADGRRFLEISAMSPLEFVEREFENSTVRAGLLFFNGLREVDLRLKGFGHSIPTLLASDKMAQMCIGGAAKLAEALCADIAEHGGEIRTGVELARILVQNGKASGVELADGERIETNCFVASGLNPQQTFLQLMDADSTSEQLRKQASEFEYNLIAPLFSLNLALNEAPKYTAAENNPDLDRAFMVIMGLDRFEQFSEITTAHEAGRIPETVMWGCCPTQFDPTQAPDGKHTAFMWEKLPYALNGDPKNWDVQKDQHGQKMLDLWRTYAPNLTDDVILDSFTRSALDTERSLPNMKFGDLLVGSFDNNQVGINRPFPGAGEYRMPVDGLYLCGGSTHPGGNITGLCGYNAARVIAADFDLGMWWNPPDVEREWSSL